jgi:hypothetical protein
MEEIKMCDEGEAPKFAKESFPIARKQHVCCECGSDIDKGEKYNKIKGFWDNFQTFKTCLICSNIRHEASRELDYDIPFECLYEVVGSEFEESAN